MKRTEKLPEQSRIVRWSGEVKDQSQVNPLLAPLRAALEDHVLIQSLRETDASAEIIHTAAHVLVDRALGQSDGMTDQEKSDFLKRSAGEFGSSEHILFVPEAVPGGE